MFPMFGPSPTKNQKALGVVPSDGNLKGGHGGVENPCDPPVGGHGGVDEVKKGWAL